MNILNIEVIYIGYYYIEHKKKYYVLHTKICIICMYMCVKVDCIFINCQSQYCLL